MRADDVPVGICRGGPFQGSWVEGPSELVSSDLDMDDPDAYSWEWDFQPFESEYSAPLALTRREAVSEVSAWQVDWVRPDLAPLARSLLFDGTGFERERFFFGLLSRTVLRPIEGVDLISFPAPLKLQSVRSVLTFTKQVEQRFPQLARGDKTQWTLAAAELLEGEFVEVSRRGWFLSPGGGSVDAQELGPASPCLTEGDLVVRARELASSERCVAFVPEGQSSINDPYPASPWTWLEEPQQRGGLDHEHPALQ